MTGSLPFWSYVFYLSKYYEWLDTVFLALKKKHLSFLHTYHHFITLWICWIQLATVRHSICIIYCNMQMILMAINRTQLFSTNLSC